jgi:CDP-diacylglycerol--serine O-phosphatidyltransferase
MYFPTLIVLAIQGLLPMFWAVVLLLIDSIGQFSRLLIRKKAANYFGKAKTAFITIVLALVAVDQIEHLPFMSERFVYVLTASCALLAFLSFYCKVIPDMWYANSLTLANFLCGLAAIVNVAAGLHLRAFILVFVGQFFDLFDGRLAQKYGSTRFGAIYDDIADGTSFGLAIGFLVFSQLRDSGLPLWIASALAALYFLCVVFRLYRFVHDAKSMPRGMFCGLPSPAGAMLAGSGVLLFGGNLVLLGGASVLLTAYLMISRIRYRHIGYRIWPALSNTVKLLGFVLFLVFVNMSIADKNYSGSFVLFCFTVAVLYAVYGVAYGSTEEDAVQSDASEEAAPAGNTVESAASSASM